MKQDICDMSSVKEEERHTALQGTPVELSSAAPLKEEATYEALSVQVLAAHCLWEIDNYRKGELWTGEYGLELLRRAIVRGDQEAWAWVQHCFSGLLRGWLHRHARREACRTENDEDYVAQAFERFWQAATLTQRVEFSTLAAALQYLRASLNGVILDTLRAYARPGEVRLPEPGEPEEPYIEDVTDSSEVWETLQTVFSDEREQGLAYLTFHCGLKSKEIMCSCPQEFSNVQEIYHMRCSIMKRFLHNADHLHWRIN